MMRIQIADHIRELRKERGMMQEQLAEALGVSVAAVSKWERGAATPELGYIVQMAELFGVSVDALIGYRVQSGECRALEERIHELQRAKAFDEAAQEAEKALMRYPDDFRLVYRCAQMYQHRGLETGEREAMQRAMDLLNHATGLLRQNDDPRIGEYSIWAEIAQCHIQMGRKAQGIELLKKHNICGMHNAAIGYYCTLPDMDMAQDAAPFLMQAFGDMLTSMVQMMSGYANYYERMGDCSAALDTVLWLIRMLESICKDEHTVTYVDKICAPLYAICADLSLEMGEEHAAEPYLRRALRCARRFDGAPTYKTDGLKFCIGDTKHARAYDDLGLSAMDAVEKQLGGSGQEKRLQAIWTRLRKADGE